MQILNTNNDTNTVHFFDKLKAKNRQHYTRSVVKFHIMLLSKILSEKNAKKKLESMSCTVS